MIFILLTIIGMLIGRKLGWVISKHFLYKTSNIISVLLCILWGISIAYLMYLLIIWQNPNIALKIIFGYCLGAYVSIPNYGLVNQSTIPENELAREYMIKLLPLLIFIVSSIFFAITKTL